MSRGTGNTDFNKSQLFRICKKFNKNIMFTVDVTREKLVSTARTLLKENNKTWADMWGTTGIKFDKNGNEITKNFDKNGLLI